MQRVHRGEQYTDLLWILRDPNTSGCPNHDDLKLISMHNISQAYTGTSIQYSHKERNGIEDCRLCQGEGVCIKIVYSVQCI